MQERKFETRLSYVDRKTKSVYIYDKYKEILNGRVLDVGADAQYLKKSITESGGTYTGIGFGETIDINFNLENLPYPFEDNSFDTVLCLDVLEHLENIHKVFDELCRVTSKYLVISLPNPWAEFFTVLRNGDYSETESMKFYGLPVNRPDDRHRWFFSEVDARKFITKKADENGFNLIQVDAQGEERKMGRGLKGFFAGCC